MLSPINEKVVMETLEKILSEEHFKELEDLDPMLAMAVISLIEDGIRIYHRKLTLLHLEEMDDYYSEL